MPLDFPSTPAPNETYSFGGSVWKWNGSVWKIVSGTTQFDYVESFNGRTGAVQGVSAAVGGTGISVSGATGAVTITNTGVHTINGATGAVTIYAGITGTAIVNGIHIANSNTTVANSVSVQLFKGLTGYYVVRGAAVPIQSTYQALDTPIPLTTGDSLKATQGVTAGLDIIVSVLEST